MTVFDLIDHFMNAFNSIMIINEEEAILDIFKAEMPNICCIEKYGDYDVIGWLCYHDNGHIQITIKEI